MGGKVIHLPANRTWRRFRSDNLRPAPAWVTPDLVRRVLTLAAPAGAADAPPASAVVARLPAPPVTHSPRAEEAEAATNGPKPAASPRSRMKPPIAAASIVESVAKPTAPTAESGTAAAPFPAVSARHPICEAERRPARQAARSAAPREPAPHALEQARAQSDNAHARKTSQIRAWAVQEAEKRIEKGLPAGRADNVHVKLAQRALEEQRAQLHRQACPVERAKLALRRRGRVVYSMAVHGGRRDLFYVDGLGRDINAERLLAEAERVSA